MRFAALVRFMIDQLFQSVLIRAFLIAEVCGVAVLACVHTLPRGRLVEVLCEVFIPVYFVVATGGSIVEKTERSLLELMLSKAHARRDIILADYVSVVGVFTVMVAGGSIGLWLVFGIKNGEWTIGLPGMFVSLFTGFAALYSFVLVSGIFLRNAALVVVAWVAYVYVGMSVMRAGHEWLAEHGSLIVRLPFDALYYFLPSLFQMSKSMHAMLRGGECSYLPFISSAISAVLVMLVAIAYFDRKDIV